MQPMTDQDLFNLLRWFPLIGKLFICVRLWRDDLHRRYPVFVSYLLFSVVRSTILLACDVGGATYMKLWISTEPVLWFLYILLVRELYSLILEHYKGLYTVGNWAVWGALVLGALSALLSLATPSEGAFFPSRLMGLFLMIERWLLLSLVIFLVLILAFLSRYPLQLTRNALVHSVVYAIFFFAGSLSFLARGLFGWEMARPVNTGVAIVTAACVLAWALLLNRRGEVKARAGLAWQPGTGDRLLGQLDSINAALLRVVRK